MTIEEKRDAIATHCKGRSCYINADVPCPLFTLEGSCQGDYDEMTERKYQILVDDGFIKEEKEPIKPKEDVVNHPSHYTTGMECIDEMILVFGEAIVADFCLCNVWKYRKRALHKNGREDLDKADWYMNKYKELATGMEKEKYVRFE